ncbi:hypothetical protein [Nocardia sp. NPDC049526]|uniref:hypothetical protein n=1 Tax=Nocardia sp. NPDC049526 TaxID=3364316 RepID=UPI00379145F0
MATHPAATKLQDTTALWSAGLGSPAEVVMAACDALVAGLDGPALQVLASISLRDAGYDLREHLPAALEEQGLEFYDRDSVTAREAAVRALARQLLAGSLTPRQLARQSHRAFGHELPLAESLACLDDEYDTIEYSSRTVQEIDDDVATEARRIVSSTDPTKR